MALGEQNGGVLYHEYEYDLAVDSGAVGSVVLSSKNNSDPLPVGAVRKKVTAIVKTTFVGGGASLQWGDGVNSDADHTAEAVAGLSLNAVFADDSNRAQSSAALAQVVVEVTGAPLTAGRLGLMVEYYYPKS